MRKVKWGKIVQPVVVGLEQAEKRGNAISRRVEASGQNDVRLRCGIIIGQSSSLAAPKDSNLLVLYQNVGSDALEEQVYLPGFPIGPVLMVSAASRNADVENAVVKSVGLYGVIRRPLGLGTRVNKVRMLPFHLNAGQAVYVWAKVPDLEKYKWVKPEVHGMW